MKMKLLVLLPLVALLGCLNPDSLANYVASKPPKVRPNSVDGLYSVRWSSPMGTCGDTKEIEDDVVILQGEQGLHLDEGPKLAVVVGSIRGACFGPDTGSRFNAVCELASSNSVTTMEMKWNFANMPLEYFDGVTTFRRAGCETSYYTMGIKKQ
jgi:hypothetical protein